MFGIDPLTPAYGRDYKSKAEIEKDLNTDKDFIAANGQYINKSQLVEMGLKQINVRYGKLRKIAVVKL